MNHERVYFYVRHTGDELKVEFEAGTQTADFLVDVNALTDQANEIRSTLTKICIEYVSFAPGARSSDTDNPILIRRLARQGNRMRGVFFDGAKELNHGRTLQALYSRRPVTFCLEPKIAIHVPWGLMFDLPPDPMNPDRNLESARLKGAQLYEGFWCVNHNLSVVYLPEDKRLIPGQYPQVMAHPKLLGMFHAKALRNAGARGRVAWPQTFKSVDDFLAHLAEHEDEEWLLYFFCHADEDRLVVLAANGRAEESILPQLFMNCFAGGSTLRSGLAFLNGCKTAVSKKARSWHMATRHRGLAGYIGTESIVPTQFAWRFGSDFLHLLASGHTPEQAMSALRQQHLPLSLLYGLYCIPDVLVRGIALDPCLPAPEQINYSQLPLNVGDSRYLTLPFGHYKTPSRSGQGAT